jgi:IclR family acetate operon transcriptional repressor
VYLAMREGTHSVRHASWVGRSIPLAGTAVGAVLTGSPAEGFVVVRDGVEADVTAIAAPVSPGGRAVAALSVVVPSYRITEAEAHRIGALVAREAAALLTPSARVTATGDLTGEPA